MFRNLEKFRLASNPQEFVVFTVMPLLEGLRLGDPVSGAGKMLRQVGVVVTFNGIVRGRVDQFPELQLGFIGLR